MWIWVGGSPTFIFSVELKFHTYTFFGKQPPSPRRLATTQQTALSKAILGPPAINKDTRGSGPVLLRKYSSLGLETLAGRAKYPLESQEHHLWVVLETPLDFFVSVAKPKWNLAAPSAPLT